MKAKRNMVRISARVYVSDVDFLDEEASRQDMNRSDILRRIVKEYVEKKKGSDTHEQ
jgi:metal-responsive CopG/Arc/MetJ family transcriptional regulator